MLVTRFGGASGLAGRTESTSCENRTDVDASGAAVGSPTACAKGPAVSSLPPRADLDQLRTVAKERLRAARAGAPDAITWLTEVGGELTLANAHLRLARQYGFPSWPALQFEVVRRRTLDRHDPAALDAFLARYPSAATAELEGWRDHPLGASPLSYLAMARYDTATNRWRDLEGTGEAARVLIAAGAPVNGNPGDRETPLITAASYGDADVAAVLIAAGADVDAVAAPDAGGVPGGSALLHAAVFGMTEVLDVLVAAGARVRSIEEAAAAGDIDGWLTADTPVQDRLRALIMAVDHQRIAVIDELVAAGTPVDEEDEVFERHPLRLAAANGRPASVAALLRHGADPVGRDAGGHTALDLCVAARDEAVDPADYDAVAELLRAAAAPSAPTG
jgi:ankyrin repeat protein